jgi:hypothetical protein
MLEEPLYPPQDNIPADTTARVADQFGGQRRDVLAAIAQGGTNGSIAAS